ncbi:MAG: hypothetical protein Q8Q67_03445 [bacterium]|nr:hypothetical protein [bacterium]
MQLPKKILIPVIIVLLMLASTWAIYSFLQKEHGVTLPDITPEMRPQDIHFMENQEKIELGLQEATRVQVLGRDENGEVISYKIIRDETDIITDIETLK